MKKAILSLIVALISVSSAHAAQNLKIALVEKVGPAYNLCGVSGVYVFADDRRVLTNQSGTSFSVTVPTGARNLRVRVFGIPSGVPQGCSQLIVENERGEFSMTPVTAQQQNIDVDLRAPHTGVER